MKLKRLQLENYRGLGGTTHIELDADVVLIHGPNGAGKSSIMSALELAMTGQIQSLARVYGGYKSHLLTSGAKSGEIRLTVAGEPEDRISRFSLSPGRTAGKPMLEGDDASFFRDRAYLAQSTLSRLLEIYDESDRKGDSELTRFVNELLGLGSLDALIEGLDPALDKRRLRLFLPEFKFAEVRADLLGDEVTEVRNDLRTIQDRILANAQELASLKPSIQGKTLTEVAKVEAASARVRQMKIERDSAVDRKHASVDAKQLADIEDRLARWSYDVGPALEVALKNVAEKTRTEFPVLLEPGVAGLSLDHARSALLSESIRLSGLIRSHRDANAKLASLEVDLAKSATEAADVGELLQQLAVSSDFSALAAALSAVSQLPLTENCPVCDRDFSEVSDLPLRDHVLAEIRKYGELAGSITALGTRRTRIEQANKELLARHAELVVRVLPARLFEDYEERLRELNEATSNLATFDEAVRFAREMLDRQSEMLAANSRSDSATILLDSLMREALDLAASLAPDVDRRSSNDLEQLLDDLDASLNSQVVTEGLILQTHRTRLSLDAERETLESRRGELQVRLTEATSRHEKQMNATKELNTRIRHVRELSRAAIATRESVVERVFDNSLNHTWRDLFTRLAPTERFLPEFVAAEKPAKGVRVRVFDGETRAGGMPGVMLSSGNLNTAALTLFLSLNLTAGPRLPMLLLDDPVQAMDDVHVAQFAALLRSLARDLGRQVVVAVHERALFEYLALELAPSKPDERLAKIDLVERNDSGLISNLVKWIPDPVEGPARLAG